MYKMYFVRSRLTTKYFVRSTHHLAWMIISGRRRIHCVAELLLYVVCLRTHSRLDSRIIHIHGHGYCTVSGPSTFLLHLFQGKIGKLKKLQTADWKRYIIRVQPITVSG